MELRHVLGRTWVAEASTALLPIYRVTDTDIILIDTGYAKLDRAGLTALIEDRGFHLRGIICSHAHFDHSGNVVREFSAAKSAFGESRPDGEEYFRADAAFFIDESTLAVKTPGGIFIYSVTGNTTVLKKCGGEKGARPPEKPAGGESSGGRKGAGREKPPAEHGNFGVSFENSCGEPKIGHGVPFEGFGALGGGGSVCK